MCVFVGGRARVCMCVHVSVRVCMFMYVTCTTDGKASVDDSAASRCTIEERRVERGPEAKEEEGSNHCNCAVIPRAACIQGGERERVRERERAWERVKER